MTVRPAVLSAAGLSLGLLLTAASCAERGERYSVVGGNEGTYVVKAEPNPVPPPPRYVPPPPPPPAPATGPSPREEALQKRIDQLEGQQKTLQDEIDRLKKEKEK